MPVEPGQTLLHYRIVDKLGEGGMGVVWRAVDTTLDREVAIKLLPEAFSEDAERLARFEREARSLASLNHDNIAAIHSVHEAEGLRFLAMELVPGIDLSARMADGKMAIGEALEIATQIAAALQSAHDSRIVHRDLKPANVKLTPGLKVKVLDFGLAKSRADETETDAVDPSRSPTMTSAGSMVGTILGTASYMSPEQARGLAVDQRADLWALGVILYEMVSGQRAFPGRDVSEVLAGVIKSDPDWDALPSDLPRSAQLVVRRCLRRDVDERLHSAADARILLQEARREIDEAVPAATGRPSLLPWALLGVTAIAALLGLWWSSVQEPARAEDPVRFGIDPPSGGNYVASFSPFFDVTPDGRTIVFAAADAQGISRLYARDLASLDSQPIAGTEGAKGPFVSEDGAIGFFAQGELREIRMGDPRSRKICDAGEVSYGASFAPDGSVVFSDDFETGLKRVSGSGGAVETLTTPDRDRDEMGHSDPYVLPSGKGVVFEVLTVDDDDPRGFSQQTAILSFDSGEVSLLLSDSHGPYRYLPGGHLLMLRADRLLALPFDEQRLQRRGEPFSFFGDEEVAVTEFAASLAGTLIFTDYGWSQDQSVVWLDRRGVETPITEQPGQYNYPSLSPDGQRVAITRTVQTWILESSGGRRMRLTRRGRSFVPLFSPDGERVVFGSYQPDENLYQMASDGSDAMELLLRADGRQYPLDWHEPDDTLVLQWVDPGKNGYGIWTLPVSGDRTARPLLDSPHNERWAHLSPDGAWLAYASDESGRYEIYVVSFPDARGKRTVSTDGGIEPRWSPRGDELFFNAGGHVELFRARTTMMVATVGVERGTLRIGTPRLLFEGDYPAGLCCGHSYDVAEDGERFVTIKGEPLTERRLHVELHALDRLRGGPALGR